MTSSAGTASSPSQLAQNLFSLIDTNGDGSISKTELEQAVTKAGGTTQAADALYSELDPDNTGSVTEQQFAALLQPPSPSGDTAQDAVLALLGATSQNTSTASSTDPANSASASSAVSTTTSTSGNTAQDALSALLQSLSDAAGNATSNGNSAQDALLTLLNNGSELQRQQFGKYRARRAACVVASQQWQQFIGQLIEQLRQLVYNWNCK